MPFDLAIVRANASSNSAAMIATRRSHKPASKATPKKISSPVSTHAMIGTSPWGAYQLSIPAYAAKRGNVPHDTPGVPGGPNNPKRSATENKNVMPRAARKASEA